MEQTHTDTELVAVPVGRIGLSGTEAAAEAAAVLMVTVKTAYGQAHAQIDAQIVKVCV